MLLCGVPVRGNFGNIDDSGGRCGGWLARELVDPARGPGRQTIVLKVGLAGGVTLQGKSRLCRCQSRYPSVGNEIRADSRLEGPLGFWDSIAKRWDPAKAKGRGLKGLDHIPVELTWRV